MCNDPGTERTADATKTDNTAAALTSIYYEDQALSLLAKWRFYDIENRTSFSTDFQCPLKAQLSGQIAPISEDATQTTTQTPPKVCDDQSKVSWTRLQIEEIHGAFFFGYAFFQVPGGIVAEKLGPKTVMLMCAVGTGMTAIVFPFFAKVGFMYAYSLRFLMGIFQGALFPSAYILYSFWLPDDERPKLLPFPSACSRLGVILMNPFVELILNRHGWEYMFYIWGGVTLCWAVVWFFVAASKPEESRLISSYERGEIRSGIDLRQDCIQDGVCVVTKSTLAINQTEEELRRTPPLDWKKLILRTKGVWPLIVVMFASEWSNFILLVNLTKSLETTFQFEKKSALNIYSGLLLLYSFTYPLAGWLASKLNELKFASRLNIRKLFEGTACSIQAICCLILACGVTDKTSITILFFVKMLGRSVVGGGQCLMPPEISRQHSGTVFAFANTIACLSCAFAPTIMTMLGGADTPESYHNFWLASASLYVWCGMFFILFADLKMHDFTKDVNNKIKSITLPHIGTSSIQMKSVKPIDKTINIENIGQPTTKPLQLTRIRLNIE